MVCPWNRHAKAVPIEDFLPRHQLDQSSLLALFNWSLETFLKKTEGSPIRRAGYNGWQRNIAVALGNAAFDPEILRALRARLKACDSLVAEHVAWAINQQMLKASQES
jgi:epoxyqueuosine reductase